MNVTRISWFIIDTHLHEFPNGDVGKFFKDLPGWQKINISFSIVAHPADLREGEKDGKFPCARQDWPAALCRGLHSRKFSFLRSAVVLLSLSRQCLKERLQTATISHSNSFIGTKGINLSYREFVCRDSRSLLPWAAAFWQQWHHWVCSSPAPSLLCLTFGIFPSLCTEGNEPSRGWSCSYNKYSYSRWTSKGQRQVSVITIIAGNSRLCQWTPLWYLSSFCTLSPTSACPQGCKNPSLYRMCKKLLGLGLARLPLLSLSEPKANAVLLNCSRKGGWAPHPYLGLAAIRGQEPGHCHLVGSQGARLVWADDIAATWGRDGFSHNWSTMQPSNGIEKRENKFH